MFSHVLEQFLHIDGYGMDHDRGLLANIGSTVLTSRAKSKQWTLLLQKICLSVVIVSRTCNRLCLLYRNSAAYRKLAYRTVHHYRHPTTHDVLDDHPQSLILSLLLHAHSLPESQRQLWQQVGRSSRNPSIAFPIAFFLLLLPLPGPHMFNCNRDRLAEISQQSKTARQNLRRGRNLAASRTKTGYSKIYMVIMEPT